jgi:nucleoside-diphosphate-sugar epimerase
MRIVVTGATGNVGTALLEAFAREPAVQSVLGLARRLPEIRPRKVQWVAADVCESDLRRLFTGADAVVHLAWLIQPSRDREATRRVNVEGSRRVFEAAAAARVGALVHASSIGAYAPGPKLPPVDESWPTTGIATSFYSQDKAAAERALDAVERAHPELRVVRLRPGLIFQRQAAEEIRRLFAGPLLPGSLLRPGLVPVVPDVRGVRVQAVHAADVADAYRRAVVDADARGAYNVAADPPITARAVARLLRAVPVPVPTRVVRVATDLTWRAHLQPTPPGWLDLATQTPLMDVSRARMELGWAPAHDPAAALRELLEGLRTGADAPTPPLRAGASGPLRVRELLSGIGARNT